jgi:putative metallohydrolase (TIGR04338 family)
LFDRAAERGTGDVEFFGTKLTLPPEARFASVAALQRHIDHVLALAAVRQRWPSIGPLSVRARRGATAAHYENRDGVGVVAVPDRCSDEWAMRELVVLHEIAHHLCDDQPPHGPQFVSAFCTLAEMVMGPELGYVLRVVYAEEGVR